MLMGALNYVLILMEAFFVPVERDLCFKRMVSSVKVMIIKPNITKDCIMSFFG